MVTIINYGSGNIGAIGNIYKILNIPFNVASSVSEIEKADKLILPGVGDFDETMILLQEKNFIEPLNETVLVKKKPIVGICVGMQILGNASEEGEMRGLGWINGSVRKFDEAKIEQKPYLPHMGWNSISISKQSSLFNEIDLDRGFYFLHSFYFDCVYSADILATTEYGIDFACVVNHENIFGFQFHPEKSHFNGMKLFENFAKI
jgi:glutamine amidotransferase